MGGYSGNHATFQRVNKLFSWPGLRQDVELFIKRCSVCQQAKHENCKSLGLLSPLPVPDSAWQDISMDFIDALPKCDGYSVILVVVDRFTKYAHFLSFKTPLYNKFSSSGFFNTVAKLHDLPKTIVSDRESVH
jgi:hypothetical protein